MESPRDTNLSVNRPEIDAFSLKNLEASSASEPRERVNQRVNSARVQMKARQRSELLVSVSFSVGFCEQM